MRRSKIRAYSITSSVITSSNAEFSRLSNSAALRFDDKLA
jgi:hypothetical protein